MRYLNKFFPRTDNHIKEGFRLAILNSILLIFGGSIIFLLLLGAYKLNQMGFPLPLPVGLLLLVTGIPYMVIFFQYGKAFEVKGNDRNLVRGLIMAMIGQIPTVLLRFLLNNQIIVFINDNINSVFLSIITMFMIVSPIMTALGSIDKKKD